MQVHGSVLLLLGAIVLSVLPAYGAPAGPASSPGAVPWRTISLPVPPSGPAALASTGLVTGTEYPTGTVRIATLLAKYFDRTVEEILDLHAQDLGFGQIAKALFTAVEADTSLETILEMRLQGIGWGEIRQELGLHPGMPHASLGQVISQGKKGNAPGQLKKVGGWTPPGPAKHGKGK